MIDVNALRRAVAAAQAVMKDTDPGLIVDGKPGTFTMSVYERSTSGIKTAVDSVMVALGIPGSMSEANRFYQDSIRSAMTRPSSDGNRTIFDLQIVPAVTREARKRGLNPVNHITQLVLETGYGKSMPVLPNGSPSYNAGGLKWNSVKTEKFVNTDTYEYIRGVKTKVKDKFAAFNTAEEFAVAYFDYLLNGPSAYRYKGLDSATTPLEFGSILQRGGYATDPKYAASFASTAASVGKRYSLV